MNSKTIFVLLVTVISLMLAIKVIAFNGFKVEDRCFLVDQKSVILFSKEKSEILYIKWDPAFSATVVHKYEDNYPYYITEDRIIRSSPESVVISWIEKNRENTSRISCIFLNQEINPQYSVIKEDVIICGSPPRLLYLGDGKYRFFYQDSSELHIIGLMHLENFEKIKTFLFSNGKVSDEKVLNKKGRFSIEDYDIRSTKNGFQIVSSQGNMKDGRHDIYLTSYASDGAIIGKQKKVYSFNDDDETNEGEDASSFVSMKFINDGFFIGRDINRARDSSNGDIKKSRDNVYEVNLFDLGGHKRRSYRIDYSSRRGLAFYGFWEKDDMCYFVGDSSIPSKQAYSLKYSAITEKKTFSNMIQINETKSKTRNILWVSSEPDGFFYWLEVDESGNIQLHSQPVQEK